MSVTEILAVGKCHQLCYIAITNSGTEISYARLCYPAPGRGTGYCFRAISFFVSLPATLRENGWIDLHEIFREGVEWPWNDLITFRVNSGKRGGGSKVNSFVIAGHSSEETSQYHSLGGSMGLGLFCRAPQLVLVSFFVNFQFRSWATR